MDSLVALLPFVRRWWPKRIEWMSWNLKRKRCQNSSLSPGASSLMCKWTVLHPLVSIDRWLRDFLVSSFTRTWNNLIVLSATRRRGEKWNDRNCLITNRQKYLNSLWSLPFRTRPNSNCLSCSSKKSCKFRSVIWNEKQKKNANCSDNVTKRFRQVFIVSFAQFVHINLLRIRCNCIIATWRDDSKLHCCRFQEKWQNRLITHRLDCVHKPRQWWNLMRNCELKQCDDVRFACWLPLVNDFVVVQNSSSNNSLL